MRYRFIQLKDLPETPTGTVFKCLGIVNEWDGTNDLKRHNYYQICKPDSEEISEHRVGKCVFDNVEWFRKEVDYDALTELKCQKCGSTKADVHIKSWYVRDMDRDDYGAHSEVVFECPCGYSWAMRR